MEINSRKLLRVAVIGAGVARCLVVQGLQNEEAVEVICIEAGPEANVLAGIGLNMEPNALKVLQQFNTNINGVPIPAAFDPLDLTRQLNNPKLFPNGNPVTRDDFPFFTLCGKMRQSPASEKVWENKMHMLVCEEPK